MTDGERRLEAPHRRGGASPRIVERSAVLGYRFASWLLRTLPARPTAAVLGLGAQGSYLLWPTKRAWSNRNFGHVLGLPPDDPRVRRVALRAYKRYGSYLVELMRVPYMPEDQVMALIEPLDPVEVARVRAASPTGGLIVTTGHVGNNDVIGAAIAHLGIPLNVVADDSAFPELFEYLRAQREQWSATLIPWRNLRAIFGVLRRGEVLGLLVDWGYRSDGIPVRLFDAWTALPAGPATLAAKTALADPAGRQHAPAGRPDAHPLRGADHGGLLRPRRAPARDPADRRRPGRDDPTRPGRLVQLQADLAADRGGERGPRAARAGDDGRAAGSRAGQRVRHGSAGCDTRGGRRVTIRGRLLLAMSWLACRLPEGPAFRFADFAGDLWYRFKPGRADQARRNLRRVCRSLAETGRGSPRVRAAATDPKALERLVRSSFRHAARYYLEVARTPSLTPAWVDERLALDTPELIAEAVVPGKAVLFVGLHFGSVELAVVFLAFRVGETVTPMETIDDPGLQAYFERTRGIAGIRLVGLREARRELMHALQTGIPVGLVGDRDLTGGGTEIPLFGAPARLPMGPAMLAVESGVPTYGMAVRRAASGHYRGKLIPIDVPTDGTRRERVTTTMTRLAAAFEDLIADAPDQWWAIFFPIWPDLEADVTGAATPEAKVAA